MSLRFRREPGYSATKRVNFDVDRFQTLLVYGALLTAVLIFWAGFKHSIASTQAPERLETSSQDYNLHPGCEIQLTASFEDDEIDYESLDLGDVALSGAGGSPGSANNTVTVRAHVSTVRAYGAHGTFGHPLYLPDFLGFIGIVWVSSDNWEFVWGEIAYSLSYNGRSTFYSEFWWPEGYEQSTREYWGTVERFNQRTPPDFVPADPMRAGMPVTFRLHPRTPRGEGSLTFVGSSTGRPPYSERTTPYTVKPGAEECTAIARFPRLKGVGGWWAF